MCASEGEEKANLTKADPKKTAEVECAYRLSDVASRVGDAKVARYTAKIAELEALGQPLRLLRTAGGKCSHTRAHANIFPASIHVRTPFLNYTLSVKKDCPRRFGLVVVRASSSIRPAAPRAETTPSLAHRLQTARRHPSTKAPLQDGQGRRGQAVAQKAQDQ